MNVLALDVGGTTIKGGLVNEKLKIKEKFLEDTPKKESSFLSLIEKIHDRFSNETEQVSLGMPGFVDNDNHIFKYGTNMQFSIDFKKLELMKDKKNPEVKEILNDFLDMIKQSPELKSQLIKEDEKTKLMSLSGELNNIQ